MLKTLVLSKRHVLFFVFLLVHVFHNSTLFSSIFSFLPSVIDRIGTRLSSLVATLREPKTLIQLPQNYQPFSTALSDKVISPAQERKT